MRHDIPDAALRLSCALGVRTHERRTPEQLRSPAHIGVGKGGNQGRKLRINGKNFPNMSAARRTLGVSYRVIYDWIATGKARYV